MFNTAGVLLILGRTSSAALAGATAAAAVLPGALSGPVLGAWLDVASRRRVLIVADQILSVVTLIALVALAGPPTARRVALSYAVLGVSALLWPLAGTLAVGIVLVAFTGFLEGPAYSGTINMRQRHAPPAVRAQVMTTLTGVALVASSAAAAVSGAVHDILFVIVASTTINLMAALAAAGGRARRDGSN